MQLQLRGITEGVAGRLHQLAEDRPLFVGSGEQSDLQIAGRGVARRHAVVVPSVAGPLLCALTARGGPRVNGRPVQSAVLAPGDELALGEHVFRVEPAGAPAEPAGVAEGAPVALAVLRATAGELAGRSFPLFADSVATLGRDPACAVAFGSPRVSRLHARIAAAPEGFLLSDAGSTNGTRVNGRLVGARLLRFGDEIALGGETLRFEAPGGGGGEAAAPADEAAGVLCPGRCGRVYPLGLEHCPLDGALLAGGRSVVR